MSGGSKGARAQPTSPVVKIGAAMVIIIVVLACMAIANGAKKKTQRNTSTRLELTRKRCARGSCLALLACLLACLPA